MQINRVMHLFLLHNLVYWVIGIVGIILLIIYRKQKKSEVKEIKRLKAFLAFLDHVFYEYTICQCVEEAILKSLEFTDVLIQEQTEEFYDLLMTLDVEELRVVKEKYASSFYYQFLIYSYLAMENGDVVEESAFLKNVNFLKKQIFIWILNREKLEHYLAGLILIVLVPIQFLKAIEVWAQFNLADLARYYESSYGVATRFLLVFITIFCYQIIFWLRQNYDVHFYQSKILTDVTKMRFIARVYDWWTSQHPKKVRQFTKLLRKSSSRLTLKEFYVLRGSVWVGTGILSLVILLPVLRLSKQYGFALLLLSVVMSLVASYIPVWYLQVKVQLMNKQKEDEAYFFYGIARMVVFAGSGDVDEIFGWLELSGDIFVPTIQVCMDEFAYDNELALEHGKRLEPFTPFVKLLDAFKVSEVIGLEQALYPLMMEFEQHIEKRKQDNEITTVNKGVFGRFIAFVPMVFVIGLYLIVPFVLESLVQLQEYIKQIQTGF